MGVNELKEVIVLVSASWCAPCKMLKKQLESLNITCDKILDLDDDYEEVSKLRVRGVPTLVKLLGDTAVDTSVGAKTNTELLTFFGEK